MVSVEIANSSLKQYYYNVINELHDIGCGDDITTEHFYYNVKDCYKNMLGVGKCIDELIEMQGEKR